METDVDVEIYKPLVGDNMFKFGQHLGCMYLEVAPGRIFDPPRQ